MAFYDTVWFTNAGDQSTTGHYAVAKRPQNTAVVAGQLARQFTAPAVGSERVFVCIVAGTTANVTDATWVLTRGAKTTDGTATWQECTGISAVNGDLANTVNWTAAKAAGTPTLGAIIKRNSATSYQICTTAGSMAASEPSFSDTAGVTTNDGTSVWTSLGAVSNFTGGQAPHARLANACASTWFAVGNTVYVGDNHAESQASGNVITPAGSGVPGSVAKFICHNHSGSYPPAAGDVTTGATITTTGGGGIAVNSSGATYYFYGIAFLTGASLLFTPNGAYYYFDNCSLRVANSSASSNIQVNTTGAGVMVWNNCTVSFGNVAQYIDVGTTLFTWQKTGTVLFSGSSVPSILLAASASGRLCNVTLEALDFSQLSGALVNVSSLFGMGNYLIRDCKLHASATVATPFAYGQTIQLVRCDSGATAYKSARYVYEGTETTETSITRVGGASDPLGQAQSRKIVTTANMQWLRPFKCEPFAIWNTVAGSNVTVTVCGTINSGTLPNNDEIWLEVDYLGSSAAPLGTIVTTTKSNVLAAGAAVSSDGSTWNGGGSGAGWSPFKLAITLSSPQPGLAGYIHARVRVGKASATFYIDPKITLT